MDRASINRLGSKITSIVPNWDDHIYKIIGDVTTVDFNTLTNSIASMIDVYKTFLTNVQNFAKDRNDVNEYLTWVNNMSAEYKKLGMMKYVKPTKGSPVQLIKQDYVKKHNMKTIVASQWYKCLQQHVGRINELDKIFSFRKLYNGDEYVEKIRLQKVNISFSKYYGISMDDKQVIEHIMETKKLLDNLILITTTPLYDYKKYIHSRNSFIDTALKSGVGAGNTKENIESLLIGFTETMYKTKLFNMETSNTELLEVVAKTLNTHIDINDPDYNAKFISMLGDLNIEQTASSNSQKTILNKSIQLITDMSKGETIDINMLDDLLKQDITADEESNESLL